MHTFMLLAFHNSTINFVRLSQTKGESYPTDNTYK